MKKDKMIDIDVMITIPIIAVTIIYLLATTKTRTHEIATAMSNEIRQRKLLPLMKKTNLFSR